MKMKDDAPGEEEFVALKRRFDQELTNGQRAELRRSRDPESLALLPGYYRVLGEGVAADVRWARTVFLLPHVRQRDGDLRL